MTQLASSLVNGVQVGARSQEPVLKEHERLDDGELRQYEKNSLF